MAKLLDLLVAAEGFVPVAGRVYAQDGSGLYYEHSLLTYTPCLKSWDTPTALLLDVLPLADDHTTAVITAEAILAARGAA